MHDIKKPRGYKPPVAKRKPATHYKLSDGRVIPTFDFMVAVLRHEIAKA